MRTEISRLEEDAMKSLIVLLWVLASLTWWARVADAEWFADVYAGGAFTDRHRLTLFEPDEATRSEMRDTKFDSSALVGGRVGYWVDALPVLGVALDAAHFNPDIPRQTVKDDGTFFNNFGRTQLERLDLEVTSLALLAMGRFPVMKSADFPNGRLQPHVGVGPSLFFSRLKDSKNLEPARQSDGDTSFGAKVVAGATWLFIKQVGVFVEYGFTHFGATYNLHDDVSGREKFSTALDTHSIVGGVTFRFH